MVLIIGNGYGERIRTVEIRISGVVPGTGDRIDGCGAICGIGGDQEIGTIG